MPLAAPLLPLNPLKNNMNKKQKLKDDALRLIQMFPMLLLLTALVIAMLLLVLSE